MSGDYSLSLNRAGSAVDYQVSTTGFQTVNFRSGGDTESFSNVALTRSVNGGTGQYTIGGSAEVDSEFYNVDYSANFTTSYTGPFEQGPTAGELQVSGPDNAVVTLSASNAFSGHLTGDSDGDGANDISQLLEWDDFIFVLFSDSELNTGG